MLSFAANDWGGLLATLSSGSDGMASSSSFEGETADEDRGTSIVEI